ncbi:MAG: hypothetical protein IJS84_06035 [Spirochaetales bacterium]|nr:hypothetical protein [Spirochaetales bacterium]
MKGHLTRSNGEEGTADSTGSVFDVLQAFCGLVPESADRAALCLVADYIDCSRLDLSVDILLLLVVV